MKTNNVLAGFMFLVATYAILTTTPPLLIKVVLAVVAYFAALQWLSQYMPLTARYFGKFSLLLILEIFKGILSVGSGRR